ncbi:hypothetical protein ebA519 [Aromatoleum aromaticum EbN1]|uniref:Uncharacterized protein n=1 Tax=Aromatoleum aromaticum (strain DSM 19018 / LMG 30748 / EbN1) TaxID=76114 RepID=Q5P8H1_AROAE|nr:hypothetical protein ebA519 [Aromatoleum aromaticum EbN1]
MRSTRSSRGLPGFSRVGGEVPDRPEQRLARDRKREIFLFTPCGEATECGGTGAISSESRSRFLALRPVTILIAADVHGSDCQCPFRPRTGSGPQLPASPRRLSGGSAEADSPGGRNTLEPAPAGLRAASDQRAGDEVQRPLETIGRRRLLGRSCRPAPTFQRPQYFRHLPPKAHTVPAAGIGMLEFTASAHKRRSGFKSQ